MPKRPCTQRAKWRLLRGQRAQHLSEHYQLECDYGTRLVSIYKEGDPVFLCEDHRTAIGQSDNNSIAGVRSITVESPESTESIESAKPAESIETSRATKNGDQGHTPQLAAPKPSTPAAELTVPVAEPSILSAKPSVPAAQPTVPAAESTVPAPSRTVRSIAAKPRRKTKDPSFRETARDLTFGNGAKALVDETLWNMATGDFEAYSAALSQGKNAAEAAQAAGGQLAMVYRKIGEYARKIEAVLSKSKVAISLADAIDEPLERAMLEIIGNSAMSDAQKDAATDHLGAFQEEINRGLTREITPLQAHRIARLVGDRAHCGGGPSLSEELKPAYRAVYTSVRNAIRAAVPQAHDLDERLANLYAAKSDLENAPAAKASCTLPA